MSQEDLEARTRALEKQVKLLERQLKREQERCAILEVSSRRHIDIAARIRADLEAQLEARSRFLATMSHEIRTPIHGVLGMLQLLEGTSPTQEQGEYLDAAKGAAESLLTVINDILDYSKIESGKMELESVPLCPQDVLDAACGAMGGRAAASGVRLYVHPDASLPERALGDPVRLQQILNNLVSNAIKFTPPNGEVTIRARYSEGRLWLEVEDSGIGIHPDKLSRIFDPFTQEDTSTTRRFGGTGLGLTICRELVRRMSGELEVQSTLGQGSTFRVFVTLPALLPPALPSLSAHLFLALHDPKERAILVEILAQLGVEAHDWSPDLHTSAPILADEPLLLGLPTAQLWVVRQSHAGGTPPPCRGVLLRPLRRASLKRIFEGAPALPSTSPTASLHRRVLVAEDNPVNQRLIQRMLERMGCTFALVGDGEAAVAAAAREDWDVILMDCQMPVMGGLEATTHIRQLSSPRKDVWIVALTANALPEDRARCLAAGMNDFLSKPFKFQDVEVVLARGK